MRGFDGGNAMRFDGMCALVTGAAGGIAAHVDGGRTAQLSLP